MLRERVTVTLEPDVIAAVDQLVDKQTIRNRSHAVEHLLKEGLGLHELTQAFFFFSGEWGQADVEQALSAASTLGVRTVYAGLRATETGRLSDVQAAIASLGLSMQAVSVPLDFGSGGALLLKREEISHPFLMVTVGPALKAVRSLLPAYTFHRQHHALYTQMLVARNGQYVSSGFDIAEAQLLSTIPAGIVDLHTIVLPKLIEEGNVRAYVF